MIGATVQPNVFQVVLLVVAALVVVIPMAIVLVRPYGNVLRRDVPMDTDDNGMTHDVEYILTNSSCVGGSDTSSNAE